MLQNEYYVGNVFVKLPTAMKHSLAHSSSTSLTSHHRHFTKTPHMHTRTHTIEDVGLIADSTHAHIHTHTETPHMHTRTYTHTHIHTHAHTHIHTHHRGRGPHRRQHTRTYTHTHRDTIEDVGLIAHSTHSDVKAT